MVAIIGTVGAITSRLLNFKYSYLIILSAAVYIYIGYAISQKYNLSTALLINGLIGLFDGTIGVRLSLISKAKNGLDSNQTKALLSGKTVVFMVAIAFIFAVIGYVIEKI